MRREGSNARLLCHERKVLLAESTEHKKKTRLSFSQGRGRSRIASVNSLYRGGGPPPRRFNLLIEISILLRGGGVIERINKKGGGGAPKGPLG